MTFGEWLNSLSESDLKRAADGFPITFANAAWNAAIEEAALTCAEIGATGFSPDEVATEIRKLKTQ